METETAVFELVGRGGGYVAREVFLVFGQSVGSK